MGKPVFFILSLVSLVALLAAWSSGRVKLFKYKTDIMVVGFTLAIALSHLRHGYVTGMLDGLHSFFPVLVGYFLFAYALDTRKKVNFFLLLLIGLTVFLAYESYLQISTGVAHGGLEPLLQHDGYNEDGSRIYLTRTRWYGVFNDPNDLGLALVLVVPLLLERCLRRQWILPLLTLPLLLGGVYWTNSRGAILSLGAGVFSYLALKYRSLRGVVFGCILAFLGMTFGPSRLAQLSGSEDSAYGRINAWYEGFQMFKSYPFFGVGSGMFTEHHSLAAHNSYILVLSELGIFGSLFFAGIFTLPLLYSKTHLLSPSSEVVADEQMRGQACALVGGLIGVMSAMFFLSRSYILLPFMMVAILASFGNIRAGGEAVGSNPLVAPVNWKIICAVVIFEILLINFTVKVFI